MFLLLLWIMLARRRVMPASVLVMHSRAGFSLLAVVALAFLCACQDRVAAAIKETGGDPHAGAEKVLRYDCVGCHLIPGAGSDTKGLVGAPSLAGIANRNVIAGELANTPENIILLVRNPKLAKPTTSMPDMGVSEQDSKDIAAFLYTLK
jgi:cytochrome c